MAVFISIFECNNLSKNIFTNLIYIGTHVCIRMLRIRNKGLNNFKY